MNICYCASFLAALFSQTTGFKLRSDLNSYRMPKGVEAPDDTLDLNMNSIVKPIGCQEMINEEGYFYFNVETTPDLSEVCSLFLIGPMDSLLRITFPLFNVNCQTGGSLFVIDGWEMKGEFFPSTQDTQYNPDEVAPKCLPNYGLAKDYSFTSSQNVAEVQHRILGLQEGFVIKLEVLENPQPCNAVAMSPHGTHTIRNFGRQINCALSIIYPEKISIKWLLIGSAQNLTSQDFEPIAPSHKRLRRGTGFRPRTIDNTLRDLQCTKMGAGDYVEFKEGDGLDPSKMESLIDVCGRSIEPDLRIELKGEHSVVRLVSSGKYDNSISFDFQKLDDTEVLNN